MNQTAPKPPKPMPPVLPMRPGRRFAPGAFPKGWTFQLKLDDERAVVMPDGTIYNRFGQPLSGAKADVFRPATDWLRAEFPGKVLDVAMLGFRDKSAFGHMRGSVVLLDIPGAEPWRERCKEWDHLPTYESVDPRFRRPAYRLLNRLEEAAAVTLARGLGASGVEGLIARNPEAPYQYGDSPEMGKWRFR